VRWTWRSEAKFCFEKAGNRGILVANRSRRLDRSGKLLLWTSTKVILNPQVLMTDGRGPEVRLSLATGRVGLPRVKTWAGAVNTYEDTTCVCPSEVPGLGTVFMVFIGSGQPERRAERNTRNNKGLFRIHNMCRSRLRNAVTLALRLTHPFRQPRSRNLPNGRKCTLGKTRWCQCGQAMAGSGRPGQKSSKVHTKQ
jgi:hypothetical protein